MWQKKKRVEGAGQREGEWNLLSVDEDDGAEPPGPTAERALAWDLYSPFFFVVVSWAARGTEWPTSPASSTSPNKRAMRVYIYYK